MRTRSLAVIGSFAAALMATPAYADATYTFNTTDNGSYTGNSSQYIFSSNQDPNVKVKVRGYSLSGLTTQTFQTSTIGIYDGGLGVSSTGDSGSPSHAVDNVGRYDFLLFEFDSANYKNLGFQIGWKDTDSDVEVWVGNGAAGLNLTNSGACSGGASNCNFDDLDNMGFGTSTTFSNVPLNSTQSVSGSLTGRYLLISGRIGTDLDDYFKVSLINGTTDTQKVPEPSSLALVAAAALGAGFIGRRRRKA